MNDEKEIDLIFELMDEYAAKLAEHADAVQILLSITENETTTFHKVGRGNYFARIGMCQEYVRDQAARDEADQIGRSVQYYRDL